MPLWHVYHPPEAFADQASKAALAKDITAIYASFGLPAFYVNVFFHPLRGQDLFIGGVPQSLPPAGEGGGDAAAGPTLPRPFVRIVGEHIAIQSGQDTEQMKRFCDKFDKVIQPHIRDKGYDWEYHVDETPLEFWRIQGFRPPPFGSEPMRAWAKANRAGAYE